MREHVRTGTEVWDGLRGIAVLTVLVYHTWLFSWYTPELSLFGHALNVAFPVRTGYLGVEIFFVISGFVLFLPYAERSAAGRPAPGVGEFARRRFLKIVPSYAIALFFTVLSTLTLVPAGTSLAGSVLNHAAFVQNFFNDQLGVANSVFWSLAIEVQFYLLFPLIAWAFGRWPVVVAALMIGIAIAYREQTEACCLQIETITRQLPAFLDLFAFGMLAALALARFRSRAANQGRYAIPATCVALGAIAVAALLALGADAETYVPGGREHWTANHRLFFGLAIAVFGIASSLGAPWWRRVVANPVFVFLGLISYNLYLWHTLVLIWMEKHGVPASATHDPHADEHWKIAYILTGWAASLAIASALTYFVERPLLGGATPRPFSFRWRFRRALRPAPSETRT